MGKIYEGKWDKMVEVSIICLIYKSTKFAKMVYESIKKHTPMLDTGKAEFFFVANDPTEELLDFLKKNKYPHIINYNNVLTDEEMFEKGFAKPEYMRRVYCGYNYGILNAKGKRVVLINSDNFFSKDWLENLLKYSEYKNIISSTLVEPSQEKYDIFPGAIKGNFGNTSDTYNDEKFQVFANKIKKTGLSLDGAYMPCILYRDVALYAGLYPEGNLAEDSYENVREFGDIYFYQRLSSFGISHFTSKDSIVYHLKEGEKSENNNQKIEFNEPASYNFKNIFNIESKDLNVFLRPTINHSEIIKKLLLKVTVVLFQNNNLNKQLEYIRRQNFKAIEILVIYDDLIDELKDVNNITLINGKNIDSIIKFINYDSFGSYILYLDDSIEYDDNFIINRLNEYENANNKNVVYCAVNDQYIRRGKCLFPKFFVKNNGHVLFFNKLLDLNYKFNGTYTIDQTSEMEKENFQNNTKKRYINKFIYTLKHDGIYNAVKKVCKKIFN